MTNFKHPRASKSSFVWTYIPDSSLLQVRGSVRPECPRLPFIKDRRRDFGRFHLSRRQPDKPPVAATGGVGVLLGVSSTWEHDEEIVGSRVEEYNPGIKMTRGFLAFIMIVD